MKTIPELKKKYKEVVIPAMKEKFGLKNDLAVPKVEKVVVNVGLNVNLLKDPQFEKVVEDSIMRITGLRPLKTKAKRSISSFKVKKGMIIGMMVTLRRDRMYDFLYKLINVTLPRVRDFKGLSPNSVDKDGNLTIGFKENICFPEIRPDEVEKLHGLEVTIVTNAKDREKGLELLKLLGFPFKV
jgi:large subunit ribosomal protein L5